MIYDLVLVPALLAGAVFLVVRLRRKVPPA